MVLHRRSLKAPILPMLHDFNLNARAHSSIAPVAIAIYTFRNRISNEMINYLSLGCEFASERKRHSKSSV